MPAYYLKNARGAIMGNVVYAPSPEAALATLVQPDETERDAAFRKECTAHEIDYRHTPGPWKRNIAPANHYPVIYAGRNTHLAAIRGNLPDGEAEANADLICAAPDLLAALEACADYIASLDENRFHNPGCLEAARAAIAKATA